tara:strand:+ start:47581 stop:47841 length:261 start_codon:yes stop_codon:yes gene_type:complete
MHSYELHLDALKRLYFQRAGKFYKLPKESCIASNTRSFSNDCANLQKGLMVLGEEAVDVKRPTVPLAKFDNCIEVYDNKNFIKYGY